MTIAGVAWFSKAQWAHLRRISADSLDETWEEWAVNVERKVAELKKTGLVIDMVPLDVNELELWCRSLNRPCDGAARAEFVTLKLKYK